MRGPRMPSSPPAFNCANRLSLKPLGNCIVSTRFLGASLACTKFRLAMMASASVKKLNIIFIISELNKFFTVFRS